MTEKEFVYIIRTAAYGGYDSLTTLVSVLEKLIKEYVEELPPVLTNVHALIHIGEEGGWIVNNLNMKWYVVESEAVSSHRQAAMEAGEYSGEAFWRRLYTNLINTDIPLLRNRLLEQIVRNEELTRQSFPHEFSE